MSRVLAVIPARLASTRLPRKVLLSRTGKPLIQHVWEGAKACQAIDKLVVATDAEEVAAVVRSFGGEAVLTSPECANGSIRAFEASQHYIEYDIVVNVQGDEPEMDVRPLDALIRGMHERPDAPMGTIAVNWPADVPLDDPGAVKVVLSQAGDALYFSRSPIPYDRTGTGPRYLKHVGLYAFRADFLRVYASLTSTPLEQAESLEQLRALEHGHRIAVFLSEYRGAEVNTPADYEAFVARWRSAHGG